MDEFNNQNNQPVQQPVQPIPVEPEKQGNPISIVAMICGIIGIVCGFIPVPGVSIAGLILAILGIVFGAIGMKKAAGAHNITEKQFL